MSYLNSILSYLINNLHILDNQKKCPFVLIIYILLIFLDLNIQLVETIIFILKVI